MSTKKEKNMELNIEIWKTTIEVQKHFNELLIKLRINSIYFLGGIFSIILLSVEKKIFMYIHGYHISISVPLIVVGMVGWIIFGFIDIFWYQRLLIGSILHGEKIEAVFKQETPEIGLTQSISDYIKKKDVLFKISTFYIGIFACLLVITSLLFSNLKP